MWWLSRQWHLCKWKSDYRKGTHRTRSRICAGIKIKLVAPVVADPTARAMISASFFGAPSKISNSSAPCSATQVFFRTFISFSHGYFNLARSSFWLERNSLSQIIFKSFLIPRIKDFRINRSCTRKLREEKSRSWSVYFAYLSFHRAAPDFQIFSRGVENFRQNPTPISFDHHLLIDPSRFLLQILARISGDLQMGILRTFGQRFFV